MNKLKIPKEFIIFFDGVVPYKYFKEKMNKQQKLQSLIELAVERGWIPEIAKGRNSYQEDLINDPILKKLDKSILFNHDFAKTLFGEWKEGTITFNKKKNQYETKQDPILGWQYHLQQAVLSDDIIEYYWSNKKDE